METAFCGACGSQVTGAFCPNCGSPNAGAGPAPAPVMLPVPVAVAPGPFALEPGTHVPAAVTRCPCCDGPPHQQWSNDNAIPGGFAVGDKVVSLIDHEGGKYRWKTSEGSIGTVIGAGTCLRRGPCMPGYTCHAMGRVMHEGVMCQFPNTPEYRPDDAAPVTLRPNEIHLVGQLPTIGMDALFDCCNGFELGICWGPVKFTTCSSIIAAPLMYPPCRSMFCCAPAMSYVPCMTGTCLVVCGLCFVGQTHDRAGMGGYEISICSGSRQLGVSSKLFDIDPAHSCIVWAAPRCPDHA